MEKTHVTLLCDRTGSMKSIRSDAAGAVNSFLDEQKLVEGECTLWLCEFDSPDYGHEEDWFTTVYEGPITDAKAYKLYPRNNTALYDALARAITDTGRKLERMAEADRPQRVIFVWQTDGMENASKHNTRDAVRAMITHQEQMYSWVFIPLGSTLDANRANEDLLRGTQSFGNIVAAAGTGHSHSVAHSHVSGVVSNLRSAHSHEAYAAASYSNSARFNAAGEEVDEYDNVIPPVSQASNSV